MNNILDLLVEYSKNERLIDVGFISRVVQIRTQELQLGDYIGRVKQSSFPYYQNIIPNKRTSSLVYNFYKRQIEVNDINLKHEIDFLDNGQFRRYGGYEKYLIINSCLLESLLHEIELANQFKKPDRTSRELEDELIKICLRTYKSFLKEPKHQQLFGYYFRIWLSYDLGMEIEKYNMIVENSAEILPTERLASIVSIKEVLRILEPIATEFPSVYKYFQQYLIETQTKGYSVSMTPESPTERFLKLYQNIYNYENSDRYYEISNFLTQASQASEEERFRLGLNVSKKYISKKRTNRVR